MLLILAGLLGVGVLTYLCGNHHGPMFAADLSAKTSTALKAAGIDPVDVSGEGQIITLKGQVATEELKARAGAEAARIWGVEEVRNLLTVAPPGPPPMSAKERAEAVNCQREFNRLLAGEKIQFQTGSAVISAKSHRLLDQLAGVAAKCPAAQISIEGHTDSRGSRAMNLKLSERRAAAVEQYLERKGVSKANLTSEGFGPDKPVAGNNTAAGMEKNRRTEFRVKGI
jgi:outer membrane protein OmpA-like peptidoglycan-associated protein